MSCFSFGINYCFILILIPHEVIFLPTLAIEDAKAHPLYSLYEEKLNLVPLDDPIKPLMRSRIQYLKYLAMASVGGGWLSEYDTMPLGLGKTWLACL